MTLIVEDGTNVPGAQTYQTAAEARAYSILRGVTLDVDDAVVEVQLVQAMDYLDSLDDYKGSEVVPPQAHPYPRSDVVVEGVTLPDDEIPQRLKDAQNRLVIEIHNGVDILPTSSGRTSESEKVGPIFTKYFKHGTGETQPVMRAVNSLLDPLLHSAGPLTTVRV